MKKAKRILAFALCLLMLGSNAISTTAFATVSGNDVVVETTDPIETEEVCEECGGSDAHTESCSFNTINILTTETTAETTQSATESTTTPAETTAETAQPTTAPAEETAEPTTTPAEADEATGCTVCGETEGHLETCSQYVAPGCAECGETEGHLSTCSQYVDPNACAECKQLESHAETCSQYVAPACAECGQSEGHLETCSKYEAPVEDIAETTGPQVGDKIWIKSGSLVYKEYTDTASDNHELLGNYEVKITEIITDDSGNATWYKFEFTSLGVGEVALSIGGYKYVLVENTSVEEPEETEPADENVCNCGENAPENLADHADSCPRKQYVKSLFENKTAEQIYAVWDNYDEELRTDLLNMLQKWDSTKYEELEKLIDGIPDGEKETTVGDISLKLQGVPEDATLNAQAITPKSYHKDLFNMVGSKKVVFAIDITLTDENGAWQPAEGQYVTVSLDAASLGMSDGERIGILHDHDGSLKDLGICTVTDGKLTFTTDGFSVFYGYTVDFEYDGTWYSIGGGSDIYLYELFAQLGITRSTSAVSSVSFSNPSLLTVSKKVVDGYTGATDWHIQSLQPFNTEEIMTITFNDGSELQINVYDATYTTLSNNLTLNDGDVINGATVSGTVNITLNGTVIIKNPIVVPAGASLTITGSGTLKRDSSFTGRMFSVTGGTLTINGGISVDGGAFWSSSEVPNSTRKKLTVTAGADTTSSAIYVDNNGTVNLTSITMKNLYTASGGQAPAIHVTGSQTDVLHSTVNMTNVVIQSCATKSGQAITLFNDCFADLTGCEYQNNDSHGTYAGTLKAGGPNYFSQLNMTNCKATGNYSSGWGGVLLWAANNTCGDKSSKATIDGCTFTSNKARYLGGALSNEAIMEVKNTTIKNNIAMAGGGIATFPFTLTETQTAGGNACGLTLSPGNTIEDNVAFASGEFTPFLYQDVDSNGTTTRNEVAVNTYNSNPVIADDSAIASPITYTGGGGGVWCYMNKPGWTCSLDIGSGNDLISNDANNVGGGVYVHNVASAGTTLSISGAKISQNIAPNGGGVAVKDATVSIASGGITSNIAENNGGGIYVDNGTCTVSGTGSVSNNTAANGGGIYINSGSLTVSGGIISGNYAKDADNTSTVDQPIAGQTALGRLSGVGGGIYVLSGTFSMSGVSVGIYGNTADFAADDAYASGDGTTLTVPDVKNMQLEGSYESAEGWFVDYVSGDTNYTSDKVPFTFANGGRYRTTGNTDNPAGNINGAYYYCLTLGRIPSLVITKVVDSSTAPDNDFLFRVTGPNSMDIIVTIPASAFTLNENNKMEASVVITKLATGEYTVTELTDWSWRYKYDSSYAVTDENKKEVTNGVKFTLTSSGEEAVFTNTREENKWLSGDCYAENWWGGTDGTVVARKKSN